MIDLMRNGRTARFAPALFLLAFVAGCSSDAGNPASPSGVSSASAAKSPTLSSVGTTTVGFSGFDASTLNVTIGTLTTAAVGQPYISEGKIQLQILVDGSGNPVPCGTVGATYVRFDNAAGGGLNPDAAGATALTVDLDNLNTWTGGAVQNVSCGASICIRAHFVTGGGSTKVDTHTSADTPYQVVCPSCTYGLGYWKNHYPSAWPASVVAGGLTIGTVQYTAAELHGILWTPPQGNGLIILAHQLITAKLNLANGADASAVAAAIASADALIGGLVIPPVGGDSLAPALTGALTQTLDNYNSGITGPGACSGS
jgi:hypothetical protein